MFRVTGVVRHLLIINVLMFFATMVLQSSGIDLKDLLSMYYPLSDNFRGYQIITHMFMHFDLTHLFFNMFALYMFGPPIEARWGARRFLFYYLFTGLGALGLHLITFHFELQVIAESNLALAQNMLQHSGMLGASGAVFGLLAAFGMLFPNVQLMLIFPPIPMRAKYFVLIYGALELFLGIANFNTGVAHFAHVGGALFGVLLILYWRKFGSRL